ncbi:CRP-like cAMP-binding protein [Mucilaginibacter frigoritolerans]|uniref:CRP-like cAMP-binding protein n=1 Tax=Mucilaginibacter frigoritolerans TaxID=652788 RepID=A0A562U713_9SPHI|nr:Crp/Fnr family transcriptional regulator [Mucilaginibacter frigoritolerans]TWJ01620.1 CRP-like cAMP-binding protein [Mucilaginibacter frigoritolerans]
MDKQLINYLQLFRPITIADGNIIAGYFKPQVFKEGDFLFEGDKVAREMFFVCKGVVRIGTVNDKGTEVTHIFYNENHLCSILQSFNDEVHTASFIQACCDTEVLSISKSKLLELYQQLPYLKELIDQLNQLNLIRKVNTRNAYLGEDAETQYRIFTMQHPDIALRVPLKDIASYLGITPQSLSRIRKNIK